MKTLVLAATAACALLAVPAMAQAQESSFYATVGYTNLSIDGEVFGDSFSTDLGILEGRVGARLNKYVGFEGELGIGIADDTIEVLGVDVDTSINFAAGAYMTLNAPVSDRVDLFARVGYAAYDFEAKGPGGTASESGGDFAYGIGAQGFFTENDGVRVDYTIHGDADAWSIAYVRKF